MFFRILFFSILAFGNLTSHTMEKENSLWVTKMSDELDACILSQGRSNNGFIDINFKTIILKALKEIKQKYPHLENIHTLGTFKTTSFYIEFHKTNENIIKKFLETLKRYPYPISDIIYFSEINSRIKLKIIFECPMDVKGFCKSINNEIPQIAAQVINFSSNLNDNIIFTKINKNLWSFKFKTTITKGNYWINKTYCYYYDLNDFSITQGKCCSKTIS
ncbi:hypothetical protein M1446_05165 [Candidatus Dependentiae bacterium]|nr:hypothetical protein [Candidatus Dependentiae bacterium]